MIKKLQEKIKNSKAIDGALIISPENRRYLTGFASSDGFLLVSEKSAVFITDSRYIEAAENTIKDCEVALQGSKISEIYDIFKEMGVHKVGIESARMTVSNLSRFQNALNNIDVDFSDELDGIINSLRMVKSDDEIKNIKAAQKIAEDALQYILGFIKPGVTEKEIALELDFYMLSNGAQALSFETIAVSGANSSMPHGVPTGRRVENGDFVTMDFGAVVDGYHSDMTRTVAVGFVTEKQRKVYETVLKAQNTALSCLKPGVLCRDADNAAREVIKNAGYGEYFGHSTGHGVGIEIHELPNLSPSSEQTLQKGNVVTVEPGIYLPGEFGVRIEDFAVITQNAYENLTKAPKELIIL